MRRIPIFMLVAVLASIIPAAAEEREYIYGAELMSPKERDAYRHGLQSASGEESKGQYRQRHHEQRPHQVELLLDRQRPVLLHW